ncbi:conserved protein of unknown function [Candidatus Promineifilum breve]|uniref:Putative restriction endonuclease domain-containing protein n=1 Tax=Candidatus Promineifilum breve TaxID=1806508 RepID=A0A160T7P9_9CHLR|nr:Uma2 family endonuclease [Candidatus Promineifilum breve]CUS05689.1 conserved protein of unknown function [Candidatus Promineifilum breve]
MSYEEYLALPDESRIIEWVDGEAIFYMPASTSHQKLVLLLALLLGFYVNKFRLGQIMVAPYEVKLWPGGPSREPDVLFIGQDRLGSLSRQRFDGGPNLVIEIISPASVTTDRVNKFREYERAGVNEYWIIDPRSQQQQADFYVRDERGLFVPAAIGEGGVYSSAAIPGFRLRLDWLWEPEEVDTEGALAWILGSQG